MTLVVDGTDALHKSTELLPQQMVGRTASQDSVAYQIPLDMHMCLRTHAHTPAPVTVTAETGFLKHGENPL